VLKRSSRVIPLRIHKLLNPQVLFYSVLILLIATYGLSGDTSGDDNNLRALEGVLETIVLRSETSNLLNKR
jgi:hypothetical protein